MPDLLDGGEEGVEFRKQRHEGDTLPGCRRLAAWRVMGWWLVIANLVVASDGVARRPTPRAPKGGHSARLRRRKQPQQAPLASEDATAWGQLLHLEVASAMTIGGSSPSVNGSPSSGGCSCTKGGGTAATLWAPDMAARGRQVAKVEGCPVRRVRPAMQCQPRISLPRRESSISRGHFISMMNNRLYRRMGSNSLRRVRS